jgi:hypothetical protein
MRFAHTCKHCLTVQFKKHWNIMVLLVFCLGQVGLAAAQQGAAENLRDLRQFDQNQQLHAQDDPSKILVSAMDIKDIRIADNVLAKAIELTTGGAKLHTITAASRNEKITLSEFLPYQDSTLEQKIELRFNKHSGLITQINLSYFLASAYLSIEPIRQQVFESALQKYGQPLSIETIKKQVNSTKPNVTMRQFITSLPASSAVVQGYFEDMMISRNDKITADPQGYAVFHSGFDQCYLWQKDNFTEILSFCGFAPQAANAANRGLEFNLRNFALAQQIDERQNQSKALPALTL